MKINGKALYTGISQHPLKWNTGGSQKMTLLANGNLGLGTDEPNYKLHIIGSARIQGDLLINSISATTYYNLPLSATTNTFITASTFNNATYNLTLTRNDGALLTTNLGLLATDVKVTGGTYNINSGVVTFTNTTGGTFNVTGFSSGMTDTFTTGGTVSSGTATFTKSNGGTYSVSGFNTGTVTAVNTGNGMNFTNFSTTGTITLGTPSSTTLASTNALTSNSHTHAFAPGGIVSQYITGAGTLVTFPTIPTVNNGTLTLATSGIATGSGTFTANQAGATTFTVAVPATNLSIGVSSGTEVRVDSSTGTDATLPVATAALAGVVTNTTQTFAGVKTFNNDVNMANTADLKFVDLAGTFPTSGKGFDWQLNNDGARIYAIQPSSDAIDFVFQLRDNATTNDRFVFHVKEWSGIANDKYPLIIRGGTEFDLKDTSLYTNGIIRLSNAGVLQNVTGNISMFTNNSSYLVSSRTLSINGTSYDLTANRSWVVPTVTANTFNSATYDLTIGTSNGTNYTANLGLLSTDIKVSGGTYNINTGVVTFTNTTGGTFNVTGFTSGMTDTFTTGGTVSSGVATFTKSNGGTYAVAGFSTGNTTSSGTTNYVSKFTGSNSLGNSLIYDNGTNVGIGTASPTSKLHVNLAYTESIQLGGFKYVAGWTSEFWEHGNQFMTINAGSADVYFKGRINVPGGATNGLVVGNSSLTSVSVIGSSSISALLWGYDGIQFDNRSYYNAPTTFTTNTVEQMRLTYDGKLGIGTTAPTSKLQVNGSITAASLIAKGVSFNNTLVAAAHNDILVGLDVNPIFSGGSLTGITKYAIRSAGDVAFTAGADRYIKIATPLSSGSGNNLFIQGGVANTSGTGGSIYLQPGDGAGGPAAGTVIMGTTTRWNGATVNGTLTVTNSGPNTGTSLQVNAGGQNGLTIAWDNLTPFMRYGLVSARQSRFTNSTSYSFDNKMLIGTTVDNGAQLQVSGSTFISGNLTATTISATTYYNLPLSATTNTFVTASTFNNATYNLTLTRNDGTSLTSNLGLLATDVKVSGGTYNINTGVVTFTNTTGGTFNVTGFSSGMTDTFTTGGTVSSGVATFTKSDGGTYSVSGFATGNTISNGTTNYVSKFTGGTSLGNSIIYDDGTKIGIGTNAPTKTFDLVGTSLSNFLVRNGSTNMLSTETNGIGGSDFRLRLWNNANTQTLDLYGSGNYDHQFLHAFRISTSEKMRLNSSGNLLINTTVDNGNKLQVSGNTSISAGLTANTALFSASTQNVLKVVGSGNSTSLPIFSVQGSQGELFSITDSLTGSLFSVNDISGLPILEAFSDNTVLMGNYLAPSLNTTARVTAGTGLTNIYSIPTSAYTGAFFDYTINDGTNLRAGNVMGIWSGTTVQYTESSTNDIGNTSGLTFNMIISGSSAILRTSGVTGSWTVKAIVRSI